MGGGSMSARGITIVNASAGSGKTTRLTETGDEGRLSFVRRARAAGRALRCDLHTKGARRARDTHSTQAGGGGGFRSRTRAASRLLGNGPCGVPSPASGVCPRCRPLSPISTWWPAIRESSFARASTTRCRPTFGSSSTSSPARTELHWDAQTKRSDWVNPVDKIMNLARSNRIPSTSLPSMAARSSKTLLALLKPREKNGAALDAALAKQVDRTLTRLGRGDGKAATDKYLVMLRQAKTRMQDGGATVERLGEARGRRGHQISRRQDPPPARGRRPLRGTPASPRRPDRAHRLDVPSGRYRSRRVPRLEGAPARGRLRRHARPGP
jgi:hypothetical protein